MVDGKVQVSIVTTPLTKIWARLDPGTSLSNQTSPHSDVMSELVASGGHTSEQLTFVESTELWHMSLRREQMNQVMHAELEGNQSCGLRMSITLAVTETQSIPREPASSSEMCRSADSYDIKMEQGRDPALREIKECLTSGVLPCDLTRVKKLVQASQVC